MISGGCCHDYKNQKTIIADAISSRIDGMTFDHIGENPAAVKTALSVEGWADKYDVVVYNFCDAHQSDIDYINSVVKVHSEGGKPAIMIHCSMHSFHWKVKENKEWVKLVGVQSPGHGPKAAITVTTTDAGKEHPIMKDLSATWKTPKGELYGTKKMLDSATPLAIGNNGKAEHAVTWVNEYGKAKVFATTLGHHNETMNDKNWQDLVANGVKWSRGLLK